LSHAGGISDFAKSFFAAPTCGLTAKMKLSYSVPGVPIFRKLSAGFPNWNNISQWES